MSEDDGREWRSFMVAEVLLSDHHLDEHLMKNDRMIIIYKVEKFWPHTFNLMSSCSCSRWWWETVAW